MERRKNIWGITRTLPTTTKKELIALQEFITIPTYLIRELPPDKFYVLADFLSMADERGEIFVTQRMLMERWKWGNTKLRNFIDYLIGKDICKPKTNQKQTRVFIVNSEFLALPQTKNKPQNKPKTNQEKVELEQGQSVKKEQMYYPNDELLDSAFREFLVMRNKIKKPIATQQALTRMMNKIEKLSGGDNNLAIKILNQSTDHCWQDVYELKEDNQNYRTTTPSFQNQSKQAKFDRLMSRIKEDEKNANGGR